MPFPKFGDQPHGLCAGCEFAGDIENTSALCWSSTSNNAGVRTMIVFDSMFNMSAGIARRDRPEDPITLQEIDSLLRKRCAGACVLERAGLVALEMSDDTKRAAMEGVLNYLPAVSRLGEVQFIDNDGDEDKVFINDDSPGVSIDH